jgi:hypothetical protein
MTQNTEQRLSRISKLVALAQMHARVRYDSGFPEIGIMVKDDVFVWGALPAYVDTPDQVMGAEDPDQRFTEDLIARARAEAKRI